MKKSPSLAVLPWRVGILTCSTLRAQGTGEDDSGSLVRRFCPKWWPAQVDAYRIVPNDPRQIARCLKNWCSHGMDVIFTVGGTGLSPTDLTPDATREVISREAPGLAEFLRFSGARRRAPGLWFSRGIAGLCDGTLIINLPGDPGDVRRCLEALKDLLPRALEDAAGRRSRARPEPRG